MNIFNRLIEVLAENMNAAELNELLGIDYSAFYQAVQIALEVTDQDYEKDDLELAARYYSSAD